LSITLREWRTMLPFTIPTPQRPSLSGGPTFACAPTLNSRCSFQIEFPAPHSCRILSETLGKFGVGVDDDNTFFDAKSWKQEAQTSAKSFLPPHSGPGKACAGAAEGKSYSIGCSSPLLLAMFRLAGMPNFASMSPLCRPPRHLCLSSF
jgi:hypothetical protein